MSGLFVRLFTGRVVAWLSSRASSVCGAFVRFSLFGPSATCVRCRYILRTRLRSFVLGARRRAPHAFGFVVFLFCGGTHFR